MVCGKSTSPLTLVSVGSSVNSTTGTITGNISSFGNPSLRWEKTYTTNIGVDFDLFRSKLSGKLDFIIGKVRMLSDRLLFRLYMVLVLRNLIMLKY